MIDNLPFDKIVQTAMRHGADFAEVFVERSRSTTILCDDRRIEYAASFQDTGVGIRALKDGRTCYGSTNDLTRKGLLALARTVGRATQAKRTKAPAVTFTERRGSSIVTVRKHPIGIPLEEKCDIVTRASDIAWQIGAPVKQVRVLYRDVTRRIWIATSEGIFATDEQVGTTFAAHVIAGDGSILQTAHEHVGGAMGFELFAETPPEEIAERATRRAIRMLTAAPAPAGSMPVIIAAEAGGTMIHEAVGHGLEADLAGNGFSVYAGRLGERVASDLITVVDDATLAGRRGTFTFDDEGTPAARTVLIEHGVLKAYLADRRMAAKLGVAPSGNARRQSYEHLPIVRMTNTFIMPGRDDPAAILRETPSGLFVRRMGGGQVNTINGDFVFDVQEGYRIEHGAIGEPVRGATLTGNGPAILSSIDRVGTDLGFSIGTCGKEGQEAPVACGQPTLRIPQIVVGGTA
jgi:TldD protein